MDAHPDDVTLIDDLTLVGLARAGDRLAFGILYLRHHAAAWRVACVASRFSSDAELAVIEGFTRVFSALPAESEEIGTAAVTFRPYLLACVRQSALDRAQAAGRAEANRTGPGRGPTSGPSGPPAPPAALAGLTIEGEVRLAGLEHHVARGALAALTERARTALWLTDVEAMTPGEVAGILGGPPEEIAELATEARAELHGVQQAALDRQEVRAECRFSAEHLAAYEAGTLDPAAGLMVRAHLVDCLACRMRQGELNNAPAALAAAVPAAPLLGGEAQHHWLAALSDVRPADRLLPPILAAGGSLPRESLARRTASHLGTVAGAAAAPARRLPDALRRAGRSAADAWQGDSIDLTTKPPRPGTPRPPAGSGAPSDPGRTGSPTGPDRTGPAAGPGWTGPPGWSGSPVPSLPPGWTVPPRRAAQRLAVGVPRAARRLRRTTVSLLPAMALAVAWVLVMMALPRLLTPSTAPGPDGLALPAVQAYFPDFSPGSDTSAGSASKAAARAPSAPVAKGLAAANPSPDRVGSPTAADGDGDGAGAVALAAATSGPGATRRSIRPAAPAARPPVAVPVATLPAAAAPVVAAAAPVVAAAAPALDTPISPQAIGSADPGAENPGEPATRKKPRVTAKEKKATRPATTRPEKADADNARSDRATARADRAEAGRAKAARAKADRFVRPDRPIADRPDRRPRPRIFTA